MVGTATSRVRLHDLTGLGLRPGPLGSRLEADDLAAPAI
jgi:hypothetical protein